MAAADEIEPPDWLAEVTAERKPKELARLMKQISERQKEVYELVKPAKHHFELTVAK